uniref:Uncharacterized protein LOC104212487 isoform X3 n=1 Tax=Nicotiana sylvestris TaxID=4096 RepID=A0A1U7V524_NICSY|nr:PREDICTED: uncharacterized protein LOC104212487 isoform X3 [Nicotiana sylvestris]
MLVDEAKILLGFSTNSCPTPCQVKAAYRRKISEAYTCLLSAITGTRHEGQHGVGYSRVVRSGVPRGGRKNHPLIGLPFIFIILGTVTLGGTNIARAYRKQRADCPSHNPFLP